MTSKLGPPGINPTLPPDFHNMGEYDFQRLRVQLAVGTHFVLEVLLHEHLGGKRTILCRATSILTFLLLELAGRT